MESITKDGMTETHIYWESDGKHHGYTFNFVNELNEAEYQIRKVKLGKIKVIQKSSKYMLKTQRVMSLR